MGPKLSDSERVSPGMGSTALEELMPAKGCRRGQAKLGEPVRLQRAEAPVASSTMPRSCCG